MIFSFLWLSLVFYRHAEGFKVLWSRVKLLAAIVLSDHLCCLGSG